MSGQWINEIPSHTVLFEHVIALETKICKEMLHLKN